MKYGKALLVSTNYNNNPYMNSLNGCVNDTNSIKRMLLANGFEEKNIITLTDEQATYSDIVTNLKEVIKGTEAGEQCFFHYSGHGGQIPDASGDEVDQLDEVIFPDNTKVKNNSWTNIIIDDEIRELFTKLQPGARLFAFLDCCNSGSAADLDNTTNSPATGYSITDKFKLEHLKRRLSKLSALKKILKSQLPALFHNLLLSRIDKMISRLNKQIAQIESSAESNIVATCGEIVMLSGCRDPQTSVDALINGQYRGAGTCALEDIIGQHGGLNNFLEGVYSSQENKDAIVAEMHDWLMDNGFEQRPVLSYEGAAAKPVITMA